METAMDQETLDLLAQIHDINFDLLCEFDRVCKKNNIKYFLAGGCLLGAVRHKDFIPWDDDIDILMYRSEAEKLSNCASDFDSRYQIQDPLKQENSFYDYILRVSDMRTRMRNNLEENAYYGDCNSSHLCAEVFIIDDIPASQTVCQPFALRLIWGLAMGHRYSIDYGSYSSFTSKAQAFILSTVGKMLSVKTINSMYVKRAKKYQGQDNPCCCPSNNSPRDWNRGVWKREWFSGDAKPVYIRGKEFPAPPGYHEAMSVTYGDYMQLPPVEKRVPDHLLLRWDGLVVTEE